VTFAAQVLSVDDSVGFIINKMKEIGLYDNTIFLFTSDVSSSKIKASTILSFRMVVIPIVVGQICPWQKVKQLHMKVAQGCLLSFIIQKLLILETFSMGILYFLLHSNLM